MSLAQKTHHQIQLLALHGFTGCGLDFSALKGLNRTVALPGSTRSFESVSTQGLQSAGHAKLPLEHAKTSLGQESYSATPWAHGLPYN